MTDEKKLTKREKKAAAFRQKQKNKEWSENDAVPESDLKEKETASPTAVAVPSDQAPETAHVSKKRSASTAQSPSPKKARQGTKEGGSRYIVFVGNLPYDASKEELDKHFGSSDAGVKSVRLMTDKVTKKPKGFAFLEFDNATYLKKALDQHHSKLRNRQINVELTAGGGGSAAGRKEKLKVKNERLEKERQQKTATKNASPAVTAE